MKYLKNFTKHNNYDAFVVGTDFSNIQQEKKSSISFCKSEHHVHYNPYVPIPQILDILYSDTNGKLSFTSEVLPVSEGKTPIALCIAGQGFFGENEKARWMSLKYMNYNTPDTGSLEKQWIYWGPPETDILTIDNIDYTFKDDHIHFGGLTADWIEYNSGKIPSLFDENNEWNLSELGTVNTYVVTDIDGKNKTTKILEYATAQPNWLTDTSIQNKTYGNYTPAACCCWRYHTLGTQQGDWYLGAGGEIAIMMVQKTKINNKLSEISALYPNDCISLLDITQNWCYWTSTECNNKLTYLISYDGIVNRNLKRTESCMVIAMLQY